MRILLIILLTFFTLNLQAKVTITSISGASNEEDIDLSDDAESTLQVLAGVSGISRCPVGTTTTANTCNSGDRSACNFKTTCSGTLLSINMSSDNTSGRVILFNDEDDTVIYTYTTSYNSGSSFNAQVAWSTICQNAFQNTNCTNINALGSKVLKLGVDSNNDGVPDDAISIKFGVHGIATNAGASLAGGAGIPSGVDDYRLFPGDEKAYLEELNALVDYNITGAGDIVGLSAFFTPGDCTTPLAATNSVDNYLIDLNDEKEVEDDGVIDAGMSNDTTYLVMFGFRDAAGNIGAFKDLTANCVNDQHTVMPREVYGLLENNQNCFISTAAFGSRLNSKVVTFRKFRDEVLRKFSLGDQFVKFYYKHSPPIANVIKEHESLRFITRMALWPVWAVSAAVLYMGLMPFLFVVTMILLSIVFLRGQFKAKKKFIAIFLVLGLSQNAIAQDDTSFFSTSESTSLRESAPNEPPYNGTENDEFSELEQSSQEAIEAEQDYEPEIAEPAAREEKSFSNVKESPDKWKPYQRVPDEKRLQELSEKGLIKITKKGGYIYDVEQSPQNSAASFRFGVASFPNLQNQSGIPFTDIYGDDKKPVLLVDYEWQFFQGFGKLGVKVGSGLTMASGSGQFEVPFNGSTDAKEKYNFYMFPNSISAVYRLDIFNKQWIVPFAEAGLDYLAFVEMRDDGDDIKFGGSPHFHFAVGGSFLLDTLGKDMMAEIDRQYGINHMWLTAEYRRLESMGADFDFSDDLINAGIMVEF